MENSIDARSKHIVITRGKKGEFYLKVSDDGDGIPRDEQGLPDFRCVATHICDSIKRRLKSEGVQGIQGEFGIGLLSFWTVGENLRIASCGADGKNLRNEYGQGLSEFHGCKETLLASLSGNRADDLSRIAGIEDSYGRKDTALSRI